MDSGTETPMTGACTPTDAPTPSEGISFTVPLNRRALASFDNLVALANHQERLREARKMVWRDRGEPVADLPTLRACLEHAAAGGLRSGTLALSIRACINLVLALIRIHRVPRDIRFAVVRHAVFGIDTLRFGLMMGTFTSVYKFLLNALPILIPALNPPKPKRQPILTGEASAESPFADDDEGPTLEHPTTTLRVPMSQRSARLSLSANAQLALIRKKTRRWHAAFAGFIAGGLAIMWEKRGRRGVIAQQMFVRGLQGSYNAYTTKRNIKVPHGDVLVFTLACGQIMYGFLLRPDTLPRSYSAWIGQAAKVPAECVKINYSLVRDGTFDVADLDKITARSVSEQGRFSSPLSNVDIHQDITPSNFKDLLKLRSNFLSPPDPKSLTEPFYFPPYSPCSTVHPALTSCSSVPLDRFFAVSKWMLPIYGALHFVPAVLFKRKAFAQDPGKVLVRAGLGSMRSSAFLGVFVVIFQTIFCYKHKLHKYLTLLRLTKSSNPLSAVPQPLINVLASKASFWFTGAMAGLALFVEEKRRRGELAMYVLPKGLESAWIMARGKGWVFRTGNLGETWLTALGMAMVMLVLYRIRAGPYDFGHQSGFEGPTLFALTHDTCCYYSLSMPAATHDEHLRAKYLALLPHGTNIYGGRISLLDDKTVVKTGEFSQLLLEAEAMRYAAEHTSIPICAVYDVWNKGEDGYLAMEFKQGQSLQRIWSTLSQDQQRSVLRTLKGCIDQLRSIPQPSNFHGAVG
ncbi:hypothetical protein DXG03_002345 [Asterophora parasitica]|uniref:Transmembrane protein 135 N-terminal domain-containing protein n=1 Tax=Asterophora parasitica TaxID=117018 RepID=A0A9P7G8Y7_9AGAR|nr:hypothetical protein DXG03_002345 [Asterophora parasitica]